MRIAAVSSAKFSGINSENCRSVNKNQYSNDVFVKSQPSFGNFMYNAHIDDLKRLVNIKESLLPIIKYSEADWLHLSKIIDVNDKTEIALQKKRFTLTSLIHEPERQSGYKIFGLVNQKLRKFDEYIKNAGEYINLSNQGKALNTEGKSADIQKELDNAASVYKNEPEIITVLRPLAAAREKTAVDIKNGLKNVEIPSVDYPREYDMANYLYAKNPYNEAKKLLALVSNCMESLKDEEFLKMDVLENFGRKLNRVLEFDESYSKIVESLGVDVLSIKPANFVEVESFNRAIDSSTGQAKKIISHNAVKLDKTFRQKFAYLPETSRELDDILLKQQEANSKISGMIRTRNREIYAQTEELSGNYFDSDLPF